LKTSDIQDGIGISHHTVHKAMTELELLEIVDIQKEGDYSTSSKTITLKPEYKWCLGRQFRQLREGFSPTKKARKRVQIDKRGSNQGANVEKGSISLEERFGRNRCDFFWETFNRLEKEHSEGQVSESMLKQELVSSGKFSASEAYQIVKDMLLVAVTAADAKKLQRLAFDVLVKNSQANMSKNE
jgi:hypothetical protein